ncbi:hypothetical protein D3832_09565 [Streptococcus mutans]|nr:hypothetical protein [Streptococcus mutans]NLQ50069.1 hypothetical protein [Streptococcus mutans]NLQ67735.1 hypothetical protein [Streptococcus mutans]NLQ75103.1 hypothetical protein [Streptococcus mutans]QIQ94737.1 hypothetical protein HB753_09850 [Streptococcus mutans]
MRKIELTMTEMKKYQTIKTVCEGKKKKDRTCVELGLSKRQVQSFDFDLQGKRKNCSHPWQPKQKT